MEANKQFEEWINMLNHKGMINTPKYPFMSLYDFNLLPFSMQWGVYLEYCREKRGVVINVYRNASGWLWSMEMSDGGTSLGWSDFTGDCEWAGVFTTFENAAKDAIELELNYGCYYQACKNKSIISNHWSNYALTLMKKRSNKESI